MNLNALLNTIGERCRTLPIVIFYVTEGCNLRCMTCSYRDPLPHELTLTEITRLAATLKENGLRHIVYSGGEPLMRRDLPEICELFESHGVKQTLHTNGLLLEKRLPEIQRFLAEIIVSVDGPTEPIHNAIRGIDSFRRIVAGVQKAVASPERKAVSIRTVLQKQNFRSLIDMVHFAKALGVDRVSFLAADVLSHGFGRDLNGSVAPNEDILLNLEETMEFRRLGERMESSCTEEFQSGFISESPGKIFHIIQYYEALLRKAPFPKNSCNAPMMSTVITSTGNLLPCFFLPPYANLRDGQFNELINDRGIRSTRNDVRAYVLERCKTCVCTLHITPRRALMDRF